MSALLLAVMTVAGAAPASAAPRPPVAAPAAEAAGGVVNLSLVRGLTAIEKPGLAGLFSFIAEKDSAPAFADLLARDRKSLKRYLAQVEGDLKAAGGVTPWDRQVCAIVLSLYAYPPSAGFDRPGEGLRVRVESCARAPEAPLSDIVARRKS